VAGVPPLLLLLSLLSDPPHAVMLAINASNMSLGDKNTEWALLIVLELLDLKLRNELFLGKRITRAAFSCV
jgi:hypothetical protein